LTTLREAWDEQAEGWIGWAREPALDARVADATADSRERAGQRITFHDVHRPLEAYSRALEAAGLLIEAIREPVPDDAHVEAHPDAAEGRRRPMFLHLKAVKR